MALIKLAVEIDSKGAVSGVKSFTDKVEDSGKKVEKSSAKMASGFKLIGASIVTFLSVRLISQFVGSTISEFAKFNSGIAEVGTLSKEVAGDIKGFGAELLKVSVDTAQPLDALQKAMFDAVSAGIPAGDSIAFLGTAGKLAVAGVTDISTATDGLTSVLNAYGLEADQAAVVSDKLFTAQKGGKTTVAELSQNIGKLAPIAAAAGVSMDEMFASVSAVTLSGISTAEAITGIRAGLKNVIAPIGDFAEAFKRAGIEVGEVAIKEKGLIGIFQEVSEKTGGSIAKMQELGFTSESMAAIATLTANGAKELAAQIEAQGNAAGNTEEAFKIMSDQLKFSMDQMSAQVKKNMVEIGQELGPEFKKIIEGITSLLKENSDRIISFARMVTGVISAEIKGLQGLSAFLFGVNEGMPALISAREELEHIEKLNRAGLKTDKQLGKARIKFQAAVTKELGSSEIRLIKKIQKARHVDDVASKKALDGHVKELLESFKVIEKENSDSNQTMTKEEQKELDKRRKNWEKMFESIKPEIEGFYKGIDADLINAKRALKNNLAGQEGLYKDYFKDLDEDVKDSFEKQKESLKDFLDVFGSLMSDVLGISQETFTAMSFLATEAFSGGLGDGLQKGLAGIFDNIDLEKLSAGFKAGGAGAKIGAEIGTAIGGNREMTNAMSIAMATAMGAQAGGWWGAAAGFVVGTIGAIANSGPGTPEGKFGEFGAGQRKDIKGDPAGSLSKGLELVSQSIARLNADVLENVLRQIQNITRDVLDLPSLISDAGLSEAFDNLAISLEPLADTVAELGINHETTKDQMQGVSQASTDFALKAIMSGDASELWTASAISLALSLDTQAMKVRDNLDAMKEGIEVIAMLDERTRGLTATTKAQAAANAILDNALLFTNEELIAAQKATDELTKIEDAQKIAKENLSKAIREGNIPAMEKYREELAGLNTDAINVEESLVGITDAHNDTSTSIGDNTESNEDYNESLTGNNGTINANERTTQSLTGPGGLKDGFDDTTKSIVGEGGIISGLTTLNNTNIEDKQFYVFEDHVVRYLPGATGRTGGTGNLGNFNNARGNAFDSGGHIRNFAGGDIFKKSTLFDFNNAGGQSRIGRLGEGGGDGEAIMPLKRTPSGKLGVQANINSGNSGNNNQAPVNISLELDGEVLAKILYVMSEDGRLKIDRGSIIDRNFV